MAQALQSPSRPDPPLSAGSQTCRYTCRTVWLTATGIPDVWGVKAQHRRCADLSSPVLCQCGSPKKRMCISVLAHSLILSSFTHSSLTRALTHSLTHHSLTLTHMQIIKPQADEQLSTLLSSSQWGLGPMCQSPGPWGTEQQHPSMGGTAGALYGGLPAGGSTKKSGLGQVRWGLLHAASPHLDSLLKNDLDVGALPIGLPTRTWHGSKLDWQCHCGSVVTAVD